MRLLLDSNILLWWLENRLRPGSPAYEAIADKRCEILVSSVSLAEISLKQSLGKLNMVESLEHAIRVRGFQELPLTWEHALILRGLPLHHRDPFDRLLVCQAIGEGIPLASSDRIMTRYPIQVIGH